MPFSDLGLHESEFSGTSGCGDVGQEQLLAKSSECAQVALTYLSISWEAVGLGPSSCFSVAIVL